MSKQKQLTFGEVRKTSLNLIQQEFYSRFPQAQMGVVRQPHAKKYYELREIPTQTGMEQKLVEVDYPITRDYVNSFATSADYHSDIASAVATPARGRNIGDATSLQELCAMDLSAIQELKNKVDMVAQEKAKAEQAKQNTETATANAPAVSAEQAKGVNNG